VATQGFVLTPSGAVSSAGLHRAAVVIEDRLRGLGVQHPHVVVVGRTLQLVTPAADGSAVQAVAGSRGVLRFRQALAIDRPLETHGSPLAARGPSESPTLTAGLLRAYNNWTCKTNPNPTNGDDVTSDYIIGCDATDLKYLLAPAAIEGSGISTASAGLVNNSGQQWTVNLGFNATASRQWLNLTRTAYRVNEGQPSDPGSCQPPKGCNAIAIVLDGVVQSAPYSQTDGIPGGTAAISGTFTQHSADRLADVLKYGALPTAFAVATVPVGTTPAGQ
jgi:preprotein translocase subunit SecD